MLSQPSIETLNDFKEKGYMIRPAMDSGYNGIQCALSFITMKHSIETRAIAFMLLSCTPTIECGRYIQLFLQKNSEDIDLFFQNKLRILCSQLKFHPNQVHYYRNANYPRG